jgi:hypothetical protein
VRKLFVCLVVTALVTACGGDDNDDANPGTGAPTSETDPAGTGASDPGTPDTGDTAAPRPDTSRPDTSEASDPGPADDPDDPDDPATGTSQGTPVPGATTTTTRPGGADPPSTETTVPAFQVPAVDVAEVLEATGAEFTADTTDLTPTLDPTTSRDRDVSTRAVTAFEDADVYLSVYDTAEHRADAVERFGTGSSLFAECGNILVEVEALAPGDPPVAHQRELQRLLDSSFSPC